jgi:hypothetical protein
MEREPSELVELNKWTEIEILNELKIEIDSKTMTTPRDSRRRPCRHSIPVGLSFLVDARQTPLRELRKELFLPPPHT